MKYFNIVLLGFFLFPLFSFSQITLSGKITDSETGEEVIGATVWLQNTLYGVYSNGDGQFKFKSLKEGKYTLAIKYLGYEMQLIELDLEEDLIQNIQLKKTEIIAEEVLITGIRSSREEATTSTMMEKEDIEKENLGQDIPFILDRLPSMVVSSDAGAGVGYTGMRIRGSDATRINVTINGIPLNDSEGHGVYWVNMPDFASSIENIQVQRGVGSSTNGSGAFGASINIQTDKLDEKAHAEISNSYGSFQTRKHTLNFGTGLIKDKFAVSGRLSQIASNGYIDRASSKLNSVFASAAWFGKKTMIKAMVMSGKEKTYQAWWGVEEDSLATNRTYNYYTYDNEVDDYRQDHYQLHSSTNFSDKFNLNAALHYTRGKGFYEQYRNDDPLSDYGLEPVVTVPDSFFGQDTFVFSDTVLTTDLIRRRWLDNHFFGITYSLNYTPSNKLNFTLGGALNRYLGDHFGEIIWARYASNSQIRDRYYQNDAVKSDFNVYLKTNWRATSKINFFLDLQFRNVWYEFDGIDQDLGSIRQKVSLPFFNPKAGISYDLDVNKNLYASFSVGSREPVRSDYIESSSESRPDPEKLYNLETGYRQAIRSLSFEVNGYLMYYLNQLALTGQINDVGAYTRVNIDKSYRTGIELQAAWKFCKIFELSGNASFSMNKIPDFTEFIDDYDTGTQLKNQYKNTDIAFSPAIVTQATLTIIPVKGLDISWTKKIVGRQYLDNTQQKSRSIDPWYVSNFRANYTVNPNFMKEIRLSLAVNNVFNHMFESNGYTYSYKWGGEVATFNYYYPQAGVNFMGGLTLKL